MTINGNLGIGTASPAQELDVAGTARMTGFRMPTGASNGYVLTSDVSGAGTWQAASAGGDITAVNAGTGLSGGGTTGDVTVNADTTYLQRRVSSSCSAGSSIRTVNSDGTVVCETDDTGGDGYSLDAADGSPTDAVYVDNDGNVGIGTATPAASLDTAGGGITVNGADISAGTGPGTRRPGLSWAETGRMNIGHGGAGGGNLEMYTQGHATRAGRLYFVYGGGDFGDVRYIHYNGASFTVRALIDKDGNVGIGTETPGYPLEMASGAHVTAGGVWTNASSREYKENIHAITVDEAMDALKGLSPVTFNYKADSEDQHAGFIAEDVPDIVATKDRKGLSSMDIVAVLTKVLQEQQKTISKLSEKVTELEREVKLKGSLVKADYK